MHEGTNCRRPPSRPSLAEECIIFVLAWLVIVPLLALVIPFAAVDFWRRERRLRRYYQSANRLMHWSRARELVSANKGTLIVEVRLLGTFRRAWWVEGDLKALYPDFPHVPTRVLDPSVDVEECFRLLARNDVAKAWWNEHLQELSQGVYLVQMPLAARRARDEIPTIPNAVAVESKWTYGFQQDQT